MFYFHMYQLTYTAIEQADDGDSLASYMVYLLLAIV